MSLNAKEPGFDLPRLPQKSEAAASAENGLAALAWPHRVELGSSAISVEPAAATPADLDGHVRIAFRVDDQPAELFVTPALYRGLAAMIEREALADDLDGKVKALLLEAGMSPDLERLEASLGWRVALEQVHPVQDRLAIDLFWFDVTLPDDTAKDVTAADGASGLLGLSLPVSHVDRLADHLKAGGSGGAVDKEPPPLPVTLALRAGSTVLSLAELKTVRAGDIVLMDDGLMDESRIAVVGGGEAWLFDARLDDQGVTLSSGRRSPHSQDRDLWLMDDLNRDRETGGNAEDASDPAPDDLSNGERDGSADPPSLDDLPIKLLFEIGRVEVSVGELGGLGPGHVFDLDKDMHRSVDIRASGKRIGRGEIVEIDGRIGVRIGRLFDHA